MPPPTANSVVKGGSRSSEMEILLSYISTIIKFTKWAGGIIAAVIGFLFWQMMQHNSEVVNVIGSLRTEIAVVRSQLLDLSDRVGELRSDIKALDVPRKAVTRQSSGKAEAEKIRPQRPTSSETPLP